MPTWQDTSHGVRWRVDLDRDQLLPGRLVGGRVTIASDDRIEARRLLVTLIGEERWQHEETSSDGEGRTTTTTVTSTAELPRVPIELATDLLLQAGSEQSWPFEVPVPPLGPATVEAEVLAVSWQIEAKLDRSGFDSRIEIPVRILQPVALLRAGVVHVGEFALYPDADAASGGITGTIGLDPMPLASGAAFRGHATIRTDRQHRLQEIRAEIRVGVEATVSSGKNETVTLWAATIAPAGALVGERELTFEGSLQERALPTIETAHGRTGASFHLILAVAMARDPHLVRDVTIATTLEL